MTIQLTEICISKPTVLSLQISKFALGVKGNYFVRIKGLKYPLKNANILGFKS